MGKFVTLTKRNLRLYLRDKSGVFCSLITMLIIIGLMLFFLGDMNINSLTEEFAKYPGRDAVRDKENATLLILAWTCAGIIPINAVTVTNAVYSVMIKDKITGKLNAIYTAPIKRSTISISYVVTAWLASVIICVATLGITELYCVNQGLSAFTAVDHLKLLGMICINSFTYSAVMYALAMIVATDGAWSVLGTVIGTVVGFLGGIYIPIGAFSSAIAGAMKCTPVIYSTVMFRTIMTEDMLNKTFEGIPEGVLTEYREIMGIDLKVGEHMMSIPEMCVILAVVGIVFLGIGIVILTKQKKTDR